MENKIEYEVHSKEKIYFTIRVVVALGTYYLIYYLVSLAFTLRALPFIPVILFYVGIILLYLILRLGLLVGYLKGNAVKVTANQFPDIYDIVLKQCQALEMTKIPDVFILQNGGLLNAFATRFVGRNYIVIYSDVLEEAYENNMDAVEFIIGHELGHIKRKHMTKSLLLFPTFIIPLLNQAYSRGCEYTCDNIGAALNNKGVKPGLLVLASGKKLWRKVNVERYMQQEATEDGFWSWFAEKVSTHPKLTRRVIRFRHLDAKPEKIADESEQKKEFVSDHHSYMPKV
ncbi:MAG: M48 family metallopeptidase [Bacteroidia bacterium]